LLMDERELIYDWNRAGGEGGAASTGRASAWTERRDAADGSIPSVRDPALESKSACCT